LLAVLGLDPDSEDAPVAATDPPARWHLLRRTCATALLCGWWGTKWKLEEVGKVLGHISVRITEMYAHLLDSVLTELAAQTDAKWTKNGGGNGVKSGGGRLSRGCHACRRRSPKPLA
jgi:hypothetical protein